MLTDEIPMLRISMQTVKNTMKAGYSLECPDRKGFLYAVLCEDQTTLLTMLDYKGTQHTLFESNYVGLVTDEAIDQCFRRCLINATQEALIIMYD